MQLIGDYYVLHAKRSNFMYIAGSDSTGFAINRFYMLENITNEFPEIMNQLKMSALFFYVKTV